MGGGRGGAGGRGGGGGGGDVQWMPDSKTLLVETVRPSRGNPPPAPTVPDGPNVQESLGGGRGARTFEDMLQNPHDEDLFEYYATSQLAAVDSATGKVTPIGKPAIFESARISPDGGHLLITIIHRPFSYLYPARQFPKEIEVWDRTGKMLHKVATWHWRREAAERAAALPMPPILPARGAAVRAICNGAPASRPR